MISETRIFRLHKSVANRPVVTKLAGLSSSPTVLLAPKFKVNAAWWRLRRANRRTFRDVFTLVQVVTASFAMRQLTVSMASNVNASSRVRSAHAKEWLQLLRIRSHAMKNRLQLRCRRHPRRRRRLRPRLRHPHPTARPSSVRLTRHSTVQAAQESMEFAFSVNASIQVRQVNL